jgi:hypothetical protein
MPADRLPDVLSRLAPTSGPTTVTHDAGDWSISLDADRIDTVGSVLTKVTATRTAVDGEPIVAGQWATSIAGKASGLLEPLRVVEVDGESNRAILRSSAPARTGSEARYYEVNVEADRGVATVERYAADTAAGTPRERVPYSLTHEVAGVLAGALV